MVTWESRAGQMIIEVSEDVSVTLLNYTIRFLELKDNSLYHMSCPVRLSAKCLCYDSFQQWRLMLVRLLEANLLKWYNIILMILCTSIKSWLYYK